MTFKCKQPLEISYCIALIPLSNNFVDMPTDYISLKPQNSWIIKKVHNSNVFSLL